MGDVLRHPHTTQERRAWSREFGRASRNPRRLPTVYDDIFESTLYDRCWKWFRLAQWKPKDLDMQTVELSPAYSWCCESCGRENFERSIRVDDPDRIAELRECLDDPDIGEGDFCTAPAVVKCRHCGEKFRTKEI